MDEGGLISNQKQLEEHILRFYRQLYTKEPQVENNTTAREECFHFVKHTITDDHNSELLKLLTAKEITKALKQLPAGKAPGVDAIPAEFFQKLWEDINLNVFNFASESINQAHISEEVRIIRTLGPKHTILDFNPIDDTPEY